jgi:hypothetical protein
MVTAIYKRKAFGSLDPALTFVSNPSVGTELENGEAISFSGSLMRDGGEEAGSYAIHQGTLNNSNYTITYKGATLTIDCSNAPVIQPDFNTNQGGGSIEPAVNKPAGTNSGDLLIVGLMYEKGSATTATAPDGWTLIRKANQGNNIGLSTYYKVAGSNEPEIYTFVLSSSPKWSVGISRIVGADQSNPIDTHSGGSGGQSFDATAPSVTTSACNALVLSFYASKKDATWTEPNGTTELYDYPNIQQGLTSNMLAYYVQSDKGSTGDKTATASLSDYWVAQQIAIRTASNTTGMSFARTSTQQATESVVEETSEVKIAVYPNPAKNQLFIQFPELSAQPQVSSISISDQIGRVYGVNSIWHQGNSSLEIDFSTLTTGLYIIRVRTDRGIQTLKVSKE